MSDCGFENPELGFQAGSTLLSPAETRVVAVNQALVSFPLSVCLLPLGLSPGDFHLKKCRELKTSHPKCSHFQAVVK